MLNVQTVSVHGLCKRYKISILSYFNVTQCVCVISD